MFLSALAVTMSLLSELIDRDSTGSLWPYKERKKRRVSSKKICFTTKRNDYLHGIVEERNSNQKLRRVFRVTVLHAQNVVRHLQRARCDNLQHSALCRGIYRYIKLT